MGSIRRRGGGGGGGGGHVKGDATRDKCFGEDRVTAGDGKRSITEAAGIGGVAVGTRGIWGAVPEVELVAGIAAAPQAVKHASEFPGKVEAASAVSGSITEAEATTDAEVRAAATSGDDDKGPPLGLPGLAREVGTEADIKGSGSFSRPIR